MFIFVGKTWDCKRCLEQRFNKVTASKSRSLRRTDTVKNKQKSINSLPYDVSNPYAYFLIYELLIFL